MRVITVLALLATTSFAAFVNETAWNAALAELTSETGFVRTPHDIANEACKGLNDNGGISMDHQRSFCVRSVVRQARHDKLSLVNCTLTVNCPVEQELMCVNALTQSTMLSSLYSNCKDMVAHVCQNVSIARTSLWERVIKEVTATTIAPMIASLQQTLNENGAQLNALDVMVGNLTGYLQSNITALKDEIALLAKTTDLAGLKDEIALLAKKTDLAGLVKAEDFEELKKAVPNKEQLATEVANSVASATADLPKTDQVSQMILASSVSGAIASAVNSSANAATAVAHEFTWHMGYACCMIMSICVAAMYWRSQRTFVQLATMDAKVAEAETKLRERIYADAMARKQKRTAELAQSQQYVIPAAYRPR